MPFHSWILTWVCLAALFSLPVQAICNGEPDVQINTLAAGSVELRFDYSRITSETMAKQMNFADTLTSAFLLDWATKLYAANTRVMRVKITEALSRVDTVSSARDTFLACSDMLVNVAKGENYRAAEFRTRMEIIRDYKDTSSDGDTLTFRQYRGFPMTCGALASDLVNPYASLIGKEFLYFGNSPNEIPVTGPIPAYDCQYLNGFWIDSLERVHRLGRIVTELVPGKGVRLSQAGNSGVPGISVPLDSMVWAFNHTVASIDRSGLRKTKTQIMMRGSTWYQYRNKNADLSTYRVNGQISRPRATK